MGWSMSQDQMSADHLCAVAQRLVYERAGFTWGALTEGASWDQCVTYAEKHYADLAPALLYGFDCEGVRDEA